MNLVLDDLLNKPRRTSSFLSLLRSPLPADNMYDVEVSLTSPSGFTSKSHAEASLWTVRRISSSQLVTATRCRRHPSPNRTPRKYGSITTRLEYSPGTGKSILFERTILCSAFLPLDQDTHSSKDTSTNSPIFLYPFLVLVPVCTRVRICPPFTTNGSHPIGSMLTMSSFPRCKAMTFLGRLSGPMSKSPTRISSTFLMDPSCIRISCPFAWHPLGPNTKQFSPVRIASR